MIAITARPARGFWRCDIHHPAARTLHADDKFSAAQLTELKAEQQLIVEVLLDDPGLKTALGAKGEGTEAPPAGGDETSPGAEEAADPAGPGAKKKPFWAKAYIRRGDGTQDPIELKQGETSPGAEASTAAPASDAEAPK